MKRHVIDHDREADWKAEYPEINFLRADAAPSTLIDRDDIVFAHLTNYKPLGTACELHRNLLKCAHSNNTPTVILYTGNELEDGEEQAYRNAMVGFPQEKIFVLTMGGSYRVSDVTEAFKRLTENAREAPKPLSEAALALRLFCEAWTPPQGRNCNDEKQLKVFRPETKADWLSPFGLSADTLAKDAAEKLSQYTERAALKDPLEKLLTAADLGQINNNEILGIIRAIRDELKSAAAPAQFVSTGKQEPSS